ncbi:DUF4817 domain-containing protein [Nephila pilipes]|uniref:DUF4817 domain-containing protein n=1 Tax=Nephila pilipes TaxID=299642 RepID=A0A8X6MZH1_NEPPI|nr:DUF4817 domain-containing protein [Nephila pilipes]
MTGKGPLTVAGLIMLVQRFEKTGSLEDRVRSGLPSLRKARSVHVAAEKETLVSESAAGTSSSRETGRRLGLLTYSIRNILNEVLNLYRYKQQSWNELLPSDSVERKAFVLWAPFKIEKDSSWVFNILWTDETHFPINDDVNNHNNFIWATSNALVYTEKPPRSPKVTVRCGLTDSFIIVRTPLL